ncbi:MAG: DUF3426 domain-containing protein [Pseudomonadota bacterium]
MIVQCEKCRSKFDVDPGRIKDAGSKVRCSNCQNVFKIFKPEPVAAPRPVSAPVLPVERPRVPPPPPKPPQPAQQPAQQPDDDFGGFGDDDLGFGDEKAKPGGKDDDLDFGSLGDDDGPGLGNEKAKPGDEDDDLDFGSLDDDDDLGLGDEKAKPVGEDDDLDFGSFGDDDDLAPGSRTAKSGGDGDMDFSGLDDLGLDDDLGLGGDAAAPARAGKDKPKAGREVEDDFGLGLGDSDEDELDFGGDDNLDFGGGKASAGAMVPGAEDDDDSGFPFADAEELETVAVGAVKKKRGRGLLWVLIFLLFILAVGAGLFTFSPGLLAPILQPLGLGAPKSEEVADDPMGNKFISPENAKHFFRQNETEGQLLIITGLARNHYKTPRSFIQLMGLLHDGKGEVLVQKLIYCGNILSEEQLTKMSLADMRKALSVRGGQNGSNIDVPPGQSANFMIVFEKIPNELAEYTVEAFRSEPGLNTP